MKLHNLDPVAMRLFPDVIGSDEHRFAWQVDHLQECAGGPLGYRLRRIMLTAFWLYGYQEFEIPHGRLFLAGENASGKSTVLTAAVPLALDGDYRPNRLDTFGGRERNIEYYILGSDNSATPFTHERRTGYVILEFEWCDPDHPPLAHEARECWLNGDRANSRFLTIGLCFTGNRNASEHIRPLRFLITDGTRFGYDLHTTYTPSGSKEQIPLDHMHFKRQIEPHGIVCDTLDDYRRLVAHYLFGYADVQEFQNLISLLLILRRPNLSSELNFSRIHDFLKLSLRKIPEETMLHATNTITQIDTIRSERERLMEAYVAAERIDVSYRQMVLANTRVAACNYVEAHQAENTLAQHLAKLRVDFTEADCERQRAEDNRRQLEEERQQVSGQIDALENSEDLQIADRISALHEQLAESTVQVRNQQQSYESAADMVQAATDRLEHAVEIFATLAHEMEGLLHDLASMSQQEARWPDAAASFAVAAAEIRSLGVETALILTQTDTAMALLDEPLEGRMERLRAIAALLQQRDEAESEMRQARALEESHSHERDEAFMHFQELRDQSREALAMLAGSLNAAGDDQTLTRMMPSWQAAVQMMNAQAEVLDDIPQPEQILERCQAVQQAYQDAISTLTRELDGLETDLRRAAGDLQAKRGQMARDLEEIEERYARKQEEPEFTYPSLPHRREARRLLMRCGILAYPLYMLIDYLPDLSEADAGRIERFLEDAGMIDALVVAEAQLDHARQLLAQHHLSDCLLEFGPNDDPPDENLTHGLRFDKQFTLNADDDLQRRQRQITSALEYIGYSVEDNSLIAVRTVLDAAGNWRHGVLAGYAAPQSPIGYIGKVNRLRVRQQELDALVAARDVAQQALRQVEEQIEANERQQKQAQQEKARLQTIVAASHIEHLRVELTQVLQRWSAARTQFEQARARTHAAQLRFRRLADQIEWEGAEFGAFVNDGQQVQIVLLGMIKLQQQQRLLHHHIVNLKKTAHEHRQTDDERRKAERNVDNVARLLKREQDHFTRLQAQLEELNRNIVGVDTADLIARLDALRERSKVITEELLQVAARIGRADNKYENVTLRIGEIESQFIAAQQRCFARRDQFTASLVAYPMPDLEQARDITETGDLVAAAHSLLQSPGQEMLAGPARDDLVEQARLAYNQLVAVFNKESASLIEYDPELDPEGIVSFKAENQASPIGLLEALRGHIAAQDLLLSERERRLFEDFLLHEVAEAIRTRILETEEWVQRINAVLHHLPIVNDRYSLDWKLVAEPDSAQLGSHLAQRSALLRKSVQTLTEAETETLLDAFRNEISLIRTRQETDRALTFTDALSQIFDYRDWFHFDVFVTPSGGHRQKMTDRVAGTRSGAERLFALYVPLFAALAATYNSAAPGAPRMLALDEAFDKASHSNIQRIITFLIEEEFQWIMTGPRITGMDATVPACARYLMLHEKGSPAATAMATFWCAEETPGNGVAEHRTLP